MLRLCEKNYFMGTWYEELVKVVDLKQYKAVNELWWIATHNAMQIQNYIAVF